MHPDSKWEFFEGEDLALNRESGIFYAVKAFPGLKNLFKTTRQTDKRKAKKELPRLIKEHLDRFQDGRRLPGEGPTVSEVVAEIGPIENPGLRQKTRNKRAYYFEQICKEMELGHLPVDKLTVGVWASRLERLRAKRTRKTFKDFVKHGNILMRYAYEQRYISHWVTFPDLGEKPKEGVVFTLDEIRQLWDAMGETLRDQFILSYQCCMRLREMLRLEWSRVDLETGLVTLRAEDVKTGSKTGKGRQFIMTKDALSRIRARKARQDAKRPSPWVFPSRTGKGPVDANTTAWENAKEKVLKKNPTFQHWGTWHHLRHTAITRMVAVQDINIAKVSEYVGTSIETLQRVYLHSKAEHTRGVTEGLRIND